MVKSPHAPPKNTRVLTTALVYVFRTRTNIVNGISGAVTTEVSCVTLGQGKILDLKFLYDDSLLVLWASQGTYPPPPSSPSTRLTTASGLHADQQRRPAPEDRQDTA